MSCSYNHQLCIHMTPCGCKVSGVTAVSVSNRPKNSFLWVPTSICWRQSVTHPFLNSQVSAKQMLLSYGTSWRKTCYNWNVELREMRPIALLLAMWRRYLNDAYLFAPYNFIKNMYKHQVISIVSYGMLNITYAEDHNRLALTTFVEVVLPYPLENNSGLSFIVPQDVWEIWVTYTSICGRLRSNNWLKYMTTI